MGWGCGGPGGPGNVAQVAAREEKVPVLAGLLRAGCSPWHQGIPPSLGRAVLQVSAATTVTLQGSGHRPSSGQPLAPGTPRAQAVPLAPTHLWGTRDAPGDAPGTPLNVVSLAPGSLGYPFPYLPRGHLASWDSPSHKHWMQISPLSIKKKKGYFNLAYVYINLYRNNLLTWGLIGPQLLATLECQAKSQPSPTISGMAGLTGPELARHQ